MQLNMMLTSLQNNAHVSHLLGFAASADVTSDTTNRTSASNNNLQLVEMLIKKLLCNISFEVVSNIKFHYKFIIDILNK